MGIKAGLVGLPNVGKSTLFNALTKSSAPAENYPFCTIDPHVAITTVPDERAQKLKIIYKSGTIIPPTVTFVDIAGLVKGAAEGAGLGNQFLGHIREVDLILHVLRCFEDPNIVFHSGETIDPIADYEVIVQELMLKDLETIEKRQQKIELQIKKVAGPEKKALEIEAALLHDINNAINKTDAATVRSLVTNAEVPLVPLLSGKKSLIIANVGENELDDASLSNNQHYQTLLKNFGADRVIPICAKIEAELTQMVQEEAEEIMGLLGMHQRGLDIIIQKTYTALDLITFFTCGPKEIHCWTIKKGSTVRQAGGEIHSDLERGFICAEVFNAHDLFAYGSIAKVKEAGKVRTEGQHYLVQDGDIIEIRFNV